MTEEKKSPAHNIILQSRRALTVTGVMSVESFDDSHISMMTEQGNLMVEGAGMHIVKLSLDSGELFAEGSVEALAYSQADPKGRKRPMESPDKKAGFFR